MSKSLVSIIVPTKNSAVTLEACLKSCREQTYDHIELIVVDNFSTDDTKAIAEKYADKVFSQGPERSAQRNYGVKQAAGEYVAIIDSDMELTPKVIVACVEAITAEAGVAGVIIPEESFGVGFWAQCKRLERSFYVGNDAIEAARFFGRKNYLDLGGYDEELVSGEDWDLSSRFLSKGNNVRVNMFILHNEGHLRLFNLLRKKAYYASHINSYLISNKNRLISEQYHPSSRMKLLFSRPSELLQSPIIGIGMLIMKTLEYFAGGCGYIYGRLATKLRFHIN